MERERRWPGRWQRIGAIALAGSLAASIGMTGRGPERAPDVAVKGALLFNFAKFVEWPSLPVRTPLVLCVVGDERIAAVVTQVIRGQNIKGHEVELRQPGADGSTWRTCHVLFVAAAEVKRSAAPLKGVGAAPVLTVSDGQGFSQAGGIVELFVDDGRMRFAINTDASARSGLQISSQLLRLAKVTHDERAH